jgi:hypothetical protein
MHPSWFTSSGRALLYTSNALRKHVHDLNHVEGVSPHAAHKPDRSDLVRKSRAAAKS